MEVVDLAKIAHSLKDPIMVSQAIAKTLLELSPRAASFYESVLKQASLIDCEIRFDTKDFCGMGSTDKDRNKIYIDLREQLPSGKISSVFVHELAEADYITRKMPRVVDDQDREGIRGRMIELLSHPHARKVAELHGVGDIEGQFRSPRLIQEWSEKDYLNEYYPSWRQLLMICWAIATLPELYETRESLLGYIQHRENIETILNLISNTDTLSGTHEQAIATMQKIIDILSTLGLKDVRIEM